MPSKGLDGRNTRAGLVNDRYSDSFEDLDEMDSNDQLNYGEYLEEQNAEIDPECFENIFGESDSEDFYVF